MKTKQIFKGTFKLRLLGLTSQSDLSETNNNTKNRKKKLHTEIYSGSPSM